MRGLGCSGEGGGEGGCMEVVGLEPGAGKRRRFPQRALALTRPTPHLGLGLLPMPGIIVKSDFK